MFGDAASPSAPEWTEQNGRFSVPLRKYSVNAVDRKRMVPVLTSSTGSWQNWVAFWPEVEQTFTWTTLAGGVSLSPPKDGAAAFIVACQTGIARSRLKAPG